MAPQGSKATIAISSDTEATKPTMPWSPPRPPVARPSAPQSGLSSPVPTASSPISVKWNLRSSVGPQAAGPENHDDTPTSKLKGPQAVGRPSWAGAVNKPSCGGPSIAKATLGAGGLSKKSANFKPLFGGIKEEPTPGVCAAQGGTGWDGPKPQGKDHAAASLAAESPATRKGKRKMEDDDTTPQPIMDPSLEVPKKLQAWILSTYDLNNWGYTSKKAKIMGTVRIYNETYKPKAITGVMVDYCLDLRESEKLDWRAIEVPKQKAKLAANQWECCLCETIFDSVPKHRTALPCRCTCPLCGSYMLVLLSSGKNPKPFVKCAKCQAVKNQFVNFKESRK